MTKPPLRHITILSCRQVSRGGGLIIASSTYSSASKKFSHLWFEVAIKILIQIIRKHFWLELFTPWWFIIRNQIWCSDQRVHTYISRSAHRVPTGEKRWPLWEPEKEPWAQTTFSVNVRLISGNFMMACCENWDNSSDRPVRGNQRCLGILSSPSQFSSICFVWFIHDNSGFTIWQKHISWICSSTTISPTDHR